MSTLDEHCRETADKLGRPWQEVHEWLDDLFLEMGPSHRKVRHHREGIEKVRARYGDEAALAAEMHVRADCGGRIPKRSDYEDGTVDNQGHPLKVRFGVSDRRRLPP